MLKFGPFYSIILLSSLCTYVSAEKPQGFFSVSKIDSRWWFIDPAGKPFYSIGVNYCFGVSIEYPPGLPDGKEYKSQIERYEPMSKIWSKRFHEWGFNTCGSVRGNWNGRFPVTPIFRCVSRARDRKVPMHKKYNFPDVFHPDFERVVDEWAELVIKPQANNPLIIGWFIDNEIYLPQDEAFQRKFFSVVVGVFRKYDKNHLLLGTRYSSSNRPDIDLRIESEYCDVLTINEYGLTPSVERLKHIYKLTGKPILIGEFTMAAKNSGLANTRSWEGALFETQADRAKGYEIYTSCAAELPFVVGTHYFMVNDRSETRPNNWGLQDDDGKLYYDFVKYLNHINKSLPEIHSGKVKAKKFPRDYPNLKLAHNDFPRTTDVAIINADGTWLWQAGYMHYACTSDTGPFYFDRSSDESWGYSKGGFIEYRFTLKKPISNAYLLFRYGSYPNSKPQEISVQINDETVTKFNCQRAKKMASSHDWSYGFVRFPRETINIPLKIDIPAGVTTVRFITDKPWAKGEGLLLEGFFLSAGPHIVDRENYYKLNPLRKL